MEECEDRDRYFLVGGDMEEGKRSPRWVILGGEGRRVNDDRVVVREIRKNQGSPSQRNLSRNQVRKVSQEEGSIIGGGRGRGRYQERNYTRR